MDRKLPEYHPPHARQGEDGANCRFRSKSPAEIVNQRHTLVEDHFYLQGP